MNLRDLRDLATDGQHRVEASTGVLEHEADILAVDWRIPEARPADRPLDQRIARQQPSNRKRQRALARPALADHGDALACAERQADPAQGVAADAGIANPQPTDVEQRRHDRLRRAAVISTSPSPAR